MIKLKQFILLEVVNLKKDRLIIANNKFNSRLIVGTGKYKSMSECAKAIKLSGAEIVTVAVRRVNISDKNKPLLMDYIDPKKINKIKLNKNDKIEIVHFIGGG